MAVRLMPGLCVWGILPKLALRGLAHAPALARKVRDVRLRRLSLG